ncbi:MAG: hypothetical protein A2036_02120 [Omnitrophica bacterium GWA2_50_21]|nr:MAG: hypothetical protein A2036_02120 [Omnitrophica bacterium GWA2_50_21]
MADIVNELGKEAESKKRAFKILAIDGGGIRGIIPAIVLHELQKELSEPIWKYFDLICGTSTGGIIALALSVGKPVEEIVELYDGKSGLLFPRAKWYAGGLKRLGKVFCGDGGRFDGNSLEQVLKAEFIKDGQPFKMKDALTRLCIAAIDITNGRVVVYKSPHSVIYPTEQKMFADSEKEMWQVALATSAAPTFFPTVKILGAYCVDGGIWANNPSLVGLTEAIRSGFERDEINILSIGTGSAVFQIEEKRAKRMNLLRWGFGKGLVELAFEAQSQSVHNQVRGLLREDKYLRVQHDFKSNIGLDDVSRINDLKAAAYNLSRDYGHHIKTRFFRQLSQHSYRAN